MSEQRGKEKASEGHKRPWTRTVHCLKGEKKKVSRRFDLHRLGLSQDGSSAEYLETIANGLKIQMIGEDTYSRGVSWKLIDPKKKSKSKGKPCVRHRTELGSRKVEKSPTHCSLRSPTPPHLQMHSISFLLSRTQGIGSVAPSLALYFGEPSPGRKSNGLCGPSTSIQILLNISEHPYR